MKLTLYFCTAILTFASCKLKPEEDLKEVPAACVQLARPQQNPFTYLEFLYRMSVSQSNILYLRSNFKIHEKFDVWSVRALKSQQEFLVQYEVSFFDGDQSRQAFCERRISVDRYRQLEGEIGAISVCKNTDPCAGDLNAPAIYLPEWLMVGFDVDTERINALSYSHRENMFCEANEYDSAKNAFAKLLSEMSPESDCRVGP